MHGRCEVGSGKPGWVEVSDWRAKVRSQDFLTPKHLVSWPNLLHPRKLSTPKLFPRESWLKNFNDKNPNPGVQRLLVSMV